MMQFAGPFRIAVVCSANVCRSPLAALTLSDAVRDLSDNGMQVSVESRGVDALLEKGVCLQALELSGGALGDHEPQWMRPADLTSASLIVTLDRTQRAAAARMSPTARPRLFTLVQAALLAEHVGRAVELGAPLPGALPPPRDPRARLGWLVTEMDAARGVLAGMGEEALDIEDAHGPDDHRATLERVRDNAQALGRWLTSIAFLPRGSAL